MRRIATLFAAFLLSLTALMAASGGPDAYGYLWRDSNEPNGPVPNWIDTNSTWVQVTGLGDDNSVGPFNSLWDFHFYWGDYRNFKIGSNGWISFDNVPNIASCFPGIPTAGGAGDNFVAPLMSDLSFSSSFPTFPNPGRCYYWTNLKDTLIVSYLNVPFWQNGTPDWTGSNTFQVMFDGTDSSITFTYLNMNPSFNNSACATDLVIGIENSTGNVGLECWREVMPSGNYAIKFNYPVTPLLSVRDLAPRWNQNDANAGEFYPMGLIPTLQSNVKNVGNTGFSTNTTVTGRLKNLGLTTVFTGTRSLATWAAGLDSTLIFTPQAVVNTAGQYYWEVTAANTADMNAGNNVTSSEIGLVDLSGPTAQLSYIAGTTSTYSWGWNGGGTDDGLGVYMYPPVHPASITSIQVFITTATSSGFIVSLFDDTGLNGGPGNVLFTDTIPFASVVTNSWNTINLPSPVSITSGGFYVAEMMGGPDLFFGTEDIGPMSRRNFEILGGQWSAFRDNNFREAMIRVTIGSYPCAINSGFNYSANNNIVDFSNQSTGGTTYFWDFGDGNTSTSLSPTHTYSALGTYTVCLIATNSCGSDTICQPVTLTCPLPSAGFSSQANGITVAFSDTSSVGTTSWLWDFGDGNTSTQQNPTHTYGSVGTFTVCLIASNACGSDTMCSSVTICNQLSIGFNFQDNNGTVSFSNISSGATFYIWDFGDGNSSTQQNPTNTYTNAGTYTVCLVISNVCYSDTLCQTLTVCPTPSAAYSFSANQGTVNFTDLTAGTNTAWMWDFGDGNTSTQQNPTHIYTASGVYTACLTVTNSCGSDTICQSVNVTVIGIADPLQGSVDIYPVPAHDQLTAKVHLPGQVGDYFEVQVMDVNGKIIWKAPLYGQGTDWTLEIATKDFAQGLYLLEIKGADFRLTKKFVKE